MAPVVAYLTKLYSRVNEFRINEKFSDVTITCEDVDFKCHRLILAAGSDYFNVMFCGSFKESTDKNVVLKEVSAEAFERVLEFIYTGDVLGPITSSNVYNLLHASELFMLPEIYKMCLQFVRENRMCVETTIDLYMFACATSKKPLMDVAIFDIVTHFRIFSRTDNFLDISCFALQHLLKMRKILSVKNDELFFAAFIRWLAHDRENRRKHVEIILKEFDPENVTSRHLKDKFVELRTEPDTAQLTDVTRPAVGYDEVQEEARKATLPREEGVLYTYVKLHREKTARLFSFSHDFECHPISEKIPALQNDLSLRCVPLDDDHLYCMHYHQRQPSGIVTSFTESSFRLYNSADLRSMLKLKDPPVIFDDLKLCALQSNIYSCVTSPFDSVRRATGSTNSTSTFSDEEIRRRIYVYNCDLDKWFPMPALDQEFYACTAITHDEILYVFGSNSPYEPNITKSCLHARAYDYRAGMWSYLPSYINDTDQVLVQTESWLGKMTKKHSNGFIHLQPNPRIIASYNITAGRWSERVRNWMFKPEQRLRFKTYLGVSWAIGNVSENGVCHFPVEFRGNEWRIPQTLEEIAHDTTDGFILDNVIFKPIQKI